MALPLHLNRCRHLELSLTISQSRPRSAGGFLFKKIFDRVLTVVSIVIFIAAGVRLLKPSVKLDTAPGFVLPTISGAAVNSAKLKSKTVLLFWATWCGPCRVELARLQHQIESHQLEPSQILAIDSYESAGKVRQVAEARGYTFPVGVDATGEVAKLYHVEATPTVVFREADGRVDWMTSGISPLLEFRVSRFLSAK